jgi:hypothetical protein
MAEGFPQNLAATFTRLLRKRNPSAHPITAADLLRE